LHFELNDHNQKLKITVFLRIIFKFFFISVVLFLWRYLRNYVYPGNFTGRGTPQFNLHFSWTIVQSVLKAFSKASIWKPLFPVSGSTFFRHWKKRSYFLLFDEVEPGILRLDHNSM